MQRTITPPSVFFLPFVFISLFWNLESNVLLLSFFPVLSSNLMYLYLFSFLFALFCLFSYLFCFFLIYTYLFLVFLVYFSDLCLVDPAIYYYSSLCSVFCFLPFCLFTLFFISFKCFLFTSAMLFFPFPITLFYLILAYVLSLFDLFSFCYYSFF